MKVLQDEDSSMFVLIMDKKEASTLVGVVEAGAMANKRMRSYQKLKQKLSDLLACF